MAPVPESGGEGEGRRSGGFDHLWRDPGLRTVVMACTGSLLFLSAFMTIEVF